MEEWRVIEGFENYQVSNMGRVKSLKTNRILKQSSKEFQAPSVTLYGEEKKVFKVRTLVVEAFIKKLDHGEKAINKNWDTTDNRVENIAILKKEEKREYKTPRNRKVLRIDIATGERKPYNSVMMASISNNCDRGSIYSVLSGFNYTAGGYIWRYDTECLENTI